MADPRMVLLARPGDSTTLVHAALVQAGFHVDLLLETPPSRWRILRGRIRRQGLFTVLGQVLFQLLVAAPQARCSSAYRARLVAEAGLSLQRASQAGATTITSVNAPDTWRTIAALQPTVVVINGTRILSAATIAAIAVPIVNMHAGITPRYRGVHGGYWALAMRDAAHCGVTVHRVDAGIDTGTVLYQTTIKPGQNDNFSTYPTLQTLAGLPLLVQAIHALAQGAMPAATPPSGDRRWYHPTLWRYLYHRVVHGVR